MSEQLNLELGKRLKERGMQRAESGRGELLERVREVARLLGRTMPGVSINGVEVACKAYQIDSADLGNATGSVFTKSEWEPCGFTQSTRPARHAGMIRVWKLKDRR